MPMPSPIISRHYAIYRLQPGGSWTDRHTEF